MRVNPKEFIHEIPDISRFSIDYIPYWTEQKKRCIEGYWVGGYWMPPSLYFYVNFGTIRLNKKNSNRKEFGRPWLRDLEWMLFQSWTVAQGFSGFKDDDIYTCNKAVLTHSDDYEYLLKEYPSTINSFNEVKIYQDPYKYLQKDHARSLGKPLYENEAQNLLILGSRDSGKSFTVAIGIVLHLFLFDGTQDAKTKAVQPAEVTVGAELAHYSTLLLNKTREAFDLLPGTQTVGGRRYPSPFYKQYKGSWTIGSEIKAVYNKKTPGGWEEKGPRSNIKHRTFKDNPFADQGSRPAAIILEEVGMFSNLEEVYFNTKDNLRDGMRKIGSLVMLGTGGDMEKGTQDAYKMFYEPEAYEILPFKDEWENKGAIGFFIPAYLALNQFKDEWNYSDEERAKATLMKTREKIRTGSNSTTLNKEMQYRPIMPSEMFINRSANIFPAPELRNRLTQIDKEMEEGAKNVVLYFDPNNTENNGVNYSIDLKANPVNDFPYKGEELESNVVVYEFPHIQNGKVPQGMYIIGCDPFKEDITGSSLAAIYVMKTSRYPTLGFNEIVAQYVGRPYLGKNAVNEILLKLSMFYGDALIYFENSVGNIKDYFEKVKRLDLLAPTPITVFNKKASYATNTDRVSYGYPMSNQKIKWDSVQYLRSWLLEDRGENTRNLDLIPDKALIKELLAFDMKTNTDRVMALVGCILGLEEQHNLSKATIHYEEARSAMDIDLDRLFLKNKRLFTNDITTRPKDFLF